MRVLMVSDVYFPRINGVSTSMETFRRALASEGVEVRLTVPRYDREPEEPGIVRVDGSRLPNDPEDRLVSWRGMHRKVLEAAADCDLIHIQTPFVAHYAGLAAARHLGMPAVVTYHTLFEEYLQHYVPFLPAGWLRGLARRFSRQQCNAADAVVVPSTAMAARLAAYGVKAPLEILPTGVPLTRFSTGDGAAFRQHHGIEATRPLALYVGRVAHEKNICFLIDAFAEAIRQRPDALLLITGEGPAMDDLRRQAARLGLEHAVRFLGYLNRERDLPDCYAAANLFVFASRTETQGLVLIEAMAAGTPVIALAAMGTADILNDAPGCIAAPDDPVAFGRLVGALLADPTARNALADQAPLTAAAWSDTAMALRLADFYRRTLARHPAHARAVTTPDPPNLVP